MALLGMPLAKFRAFKPRNAAQIIAARMIQDAAKGLSPMVREVLDRTEGKVPLPIMSEGPLEMNVRIVHIGSGGTKPRHRTSTSAG